MRKQKQGRHEAPTTPAYHVVATPGYEPRHRRPTWVEITAAKETAKRKRVGR